jgi:hypothetical protein
MTVRGLPHSGIPGSQLAYSSPRHFGVRPALHRLLAPRHPPCALIRLTSLGLPDESLLYVSCQGALEVKPSKLNKVLSVRIQS